MSTGACYETAVRRTNSGILLLPTADFSMEPMVNVGMAKHVAGHVLDMAKRPGCSFQPTRSQRGFIAILGNRYTWAEKTEGMDSYTFSDC